MIFGERIKKLREDINISQKDLGECIGVSDVMISMYEQNKNYPSINTILKLSDYFNVSIDYLFGREDQDDNIKFNLFIKEIRSEIGSEVSDEDILKLWNFYKNIIER